MPVSIRKYVMTPLLVIFQEVSFRSGNSANRDAIAESFYHRYYLENPEHYLIVVLRLLMLG